MTKKRKIIVALTLATAVPFAQLQLLATPSAKAIQSQNQIVERNEMGETIAAKKGKHPKKNKQSKKGKNQTKKKMSKKGKHPKENKKQMGKNIADGQQKSM